jgi:hypothetical protein
MTRTERLSREDDTPAPSPIIIGQNATHVTIAFAISRTELARHRRFIEMLLQAATAPAIGDDE